MEEKNQNVSKEELISLINTIESSKVIDYIACLIKDMKEQWGV